MERSPSFSMLKSKVVEMLRNGLSDDLTYHNIDHTLDVLNSVEVLAKLESVDGSDDKLILRTAALLHDTGFLSTYDGHEKKSCAVAEEILPEFGYSNEQIQSVCDLIMATKMPQTPDTHLQKIICDADLDYLGREDYKPIADRLYEELRRRNDIAGIEEWNEIQLKFLKNHTYWTETSKSLREPGKIKNLSKFTNSTS